ncbi:type VI secretion system tip protein VgrG [Pseudaestuariivita atlantica]|uniref:Gp5/Type VI secretion system Vgr protein OB-fold domain-containing protein n=1 Tax=Pseudaestuariivita atlantica TaxID=1317121 RepID=A0A0L1JMY3_9RHOB|nr:type VI secretion system tip protein VgrG [Pseudaestuariivita atlantica]KNG93067.1 hypothetical protein ATO11_14205 [Pseudaestuariivita atlantica]
MPKSVMMTDADLVTFQVKTDGATIPDTVQVARIEVDHAVNRIPRARITVVDGSPSDEDFAISSGSVFVPGKRVEIALGYHAKNTPVFKGVILGQTLRVLPGDVSHMIVDCADPAVITTLTRKSALYLDAKDSDVIGKILADAGLSQSVSATGTTRPQQVQAATSDWDFILSRAEANGMIALVRDGKVTVAPPRFDSPDFEVTFGDTLYSADLSLDATDQLGGVTSTGWDAATQKPVEAAASEPKVNKQGNIDGRKLSAVLKSTKCQQASYATPDAASLKDWAEARLTKSRLSLYRGTLSFPGNPDIKPGRLLGLKGMGTRFNGDGYMGRVRHDVMEGRWTTEVTLGLDARFFTETHRDASDALSAGIRPGISGLQIGTVLQVHQDPDNAARIKVALPLQEGGSGGQWLRLAAPYAGKGIGMTFLPEVGDEVVVGYLDGDPDGGIVLGALHSPKAARAFEPTETNAQKGITTREKLKIGFDDDEKVLTIETPGGQSIALSDKDKSLVLTDMNGNTVSLSESGITLKSAKDIELVADQQIKLTGKTGVDVKASSGDFAASGGNVRIKGDMGASVEGSAQLDLKGGAMATLKATMVKIN